MRLLTLLLLISSFSTAEETVSSEIIKTKGTLIHLTKVDNLLKRIVVFHNDYSGSRQYKLEGETLMLKHNETPITLKPHPKETTFYIFHKKQMYSGLIDITADQFNS